MIKLINTKDIEGYGNSGYISAPNENFITDFKKINIFIGGNNSGKSRFMRFIIKDLNKILPFNKTIISYLLTKNIEFNTNLETLYKLTGEEIFNVQLNSSFIEMEFWSHFTGSKINTYLNEIIKPKNYRITTLNAITGALNKISEVHKTIFPEPKIGLVTGKNNPIKNYTYIPILRGLKPLQISKAQAEISHDYTDVFYERIKADYPYISNVDTGLEINEKIKEMLLGDESQRQLIKSFEEFISKHLFNNQQITLIPKYGENELHIKIGNNLQFHIKDLGDGLQSLICIFFPIFIKRNEEHIFFIEEPETHLHPEMQRKFGEILNMDLFNSHQYFITTHSSHILNIANTSILEFSKNESAIKIKHLNNKADVISLLNKIGYRPSDLLQTNFIIWVEGQTDKMFLKSLITRFYPYLLENFHYSIMFYGGSGDKYLLDTTNNFESILTLNRNCAVIKDSDRTTLDDDVSKKKSILDALEKQGVITWLTSKREIENHISQEDFLKALKLQQKNDDIVMLEPTSYGDYYKVKINNDTTQPYSPNRNIYLSDDLFKEIGRRKGNLAKSNPEFIAQELQTSLNMSKNIKPIKDKVAIAEKLIEIGFEVDDELSEFVDKLCGRIKEVNNII